MRAIVTTRHGDPRLEPKLLELRTDAAAVAPLADGRLRLRVHACALNHIDTKMLLRAATAPFTPGVEVSGVVEAVGPKCEGFRPGDRVMAVVRPRAGGGGLAESVVVEAALAAKLPSGLRHIEAASLPFAGVVALEALRVAKLRPGARVVILGAATAVGVLVAQLARRAGAAFVGGTALEPALVEGLGLDQVLPEDPHAWAAGLPKRELDAVFNCHGGEPTAWRDAEAVLHARGVYVTLLGEILDGSGSVTSATQLLTLGFVSMWKAFWPTTSKLKPVGLFPSTKTMEELLAMVYAEQLRPIVDPSTPVAFQPGAVQSALAQLQDGRVRGKLVVAVRPEEGETK